MFNVFLNIFIVIFNSLIIYIYFKEALFKLRQQIDIVAQRIADEIELKVHNKQNGGKGRY